MEDIFVSNPHPASVIEGAYLFNVTVDGVEGSVLLAPPRDDPDASLVPYGDSPDHWVSKTLLEHLTHLSDRDFRETLTKIADAARAALRARDPNKENE
jgi:hypothetical protein